ncbi:MAG TPA: hypothetical protein VM889_07445 [Candidatus Thermoplasmatota archaeon]|nr:hypothetical protein [Candidatus Thermoplasmatota archaeon]
MRPILLAAALVALAPAVAAESIPPPETEMTCVGQTLGSTSAQACADPDDAYARVSCYNTLIVRFTCSGL